MNAPCTCAANFNVNKDELYFPNRARERREAPRARQAKVAALGAAVGGGEKFEKGGCFGGRKNDSVLATEHARSPRRATIPRLFGGSRLSESRNVLTVYSIRSRWSRLQNHFRILTDGSRRTAAGWTKMRIRISPLTPASKTP